MLYNWFQILIGAFLSLQKLVSCFLNSLQLAISNWEERTENKWEISTYCLAMMSWCAYLVSLAWHLIKALLRLPIWKLHNILLHYNTYCTCIDYVCLDPSTWTKTLRDPVHVEILRDIVILLTPDISWSHDFDNQLSQ